ncbi:NADH-quinone oxidoreductase subunit L [Bacteroidetes/Chlorobi group bacterium ChocPot_Mid]|nr:MAG: NADH-quinone oxidoreductase subunit L [Bacteroidetes/Chlorobi group bacterium ChocPot_Mid]
MYELIKFVPLIPLIGFLTVGLFGKYLKKEALIGGIASGAVGISFVLSLIIFFDMAGNSPHNPYIVPVFTWISAGDFSVNISYQADQLSILFSLIVTGVGFLIHVYSIGYMHGDRSFYRFFAYLNLFIFMMLNLVLSSNYLLTFLGWEGVGLCSYLLIGFWYDRKFDGVRITWTGDAANKAFIVNRIGDFGFLIAMFLIFLNFNTLEYTHVLDSASSQSSVFYGSGLMTAITLLMFLGCTGKSAQIPLAVWLPDAMAGPTPVSALIHAATMVTAGIFLIARNSVLFALSPVSMEVVMIVGILTAFTAASIGIVQNDFKKVLAYSTVSQLGFMFAALGVGAFTAGVFHVMTHAFFKGLLFLAAGAVIHGMHDEQNIKRMGGLAHHMPTTYKTFFVATLAIAGIPLFSGFFSKDEILWLTFSNGGWFAWLILATAAFFTAFYMFRLLKLVFHGKERFDHHKVHPHEAPKTMLFALVTLAVLSAFGGFLGIPEALGGWFSGHPNMIHNWLHPVFSDAETIILKYAPVHSHPAHIVEYLFMLISIGIAVGGILLAKKFYEDEQWAMPRLLAKKFKGIYNILWNKYYLDNFYFSVIVDPLVTTSRNLLWSVFDVKIIDGFVNGLANVTTSGGQLVRKIQSGIAQNYATLMIGGIVVILTWLLISL